MSGVSGVGDAPLWEPSPERVAASGMARYLRWLDSSAGLRFAAYDDVWRWSVTDLEGFWASIWDYFEVFAHRPYERVLASREMPGAAWFPGATLNYAQHALARRGGAAALVSASEAGGLATMTRDELARQVAAVAGAFRRLGVGRGDRVAAYLPNIAEAVVAFLATASLGAVWSSCAPEFGPRSVVDRFRQIEPTILVACDGYRYGGRAFDRRAEVAEIRASCQRWRRWSG